ncbi:hypothetical protein V6N13_080946 [Hibiscus sabdariffa]
MRARTPLVFMRTPRAKSSRIGHLKKRKTRKILTILAEEARSVTRITNPTEMFANIKTKLVLVPIIKNVGGNKIPTTNSSTLPLMAVPSFPPGINGRNVNKNIVMQTITGIATYNSFSPLIKHTATTRRDQHDRSLTAAAVKAVLPRSVYMSLRPENIRARSGKLVTLRAMDQK